MNYKSNTAYLLSPRPFLPVKQSLLYCFLGYVYLLGIIDYTYLFINIRLQQFIVLNYICLLYVYNFFLKRNLPNISAV